ncbi:FAD-dependent oxidoreductase [Altericista sp. CCNU0014]|uniref:FAD-dependent oxidoreductase n=1 Tax=Altericista sp. CCNU0014 TaxID=3082949 RepID=UPI00384E0B01
MESLAPSPLSLNLKKDRHFVILGGGVAGLATAQALLKRGCRVTLVEKGAEVGGLARTFTHEGFRFDIGGHRFHSNNPSVVQWIKDLLKTDLRVVPRVSHIHLGGQFVDYPIRLPNALFFFSPWRAFYMVASYIKARLVSEKGRREISFEDWVIKRYGKALYSVFFKPYTEKVWGIPCDQLAASWAFQRIKVLSFWRILKGFVVPQKEVSETAISQFYYPRAGFGMIPEALQQEILDMGGVIYTSTALTHCIPQDLGFQVVVERQDGTRETLLADRVISTIPLDCLLKAIPSELGSPEILEKCSLEYRDIICLFLALQKKQVSQDSWTYFPMKQLLFGRTHEPKNWSEEMVPSQDFTSLVVEIFSSRGEFTWDLSDSDLLAKVVEQMNEIGWIDKNEVYKSWVLRVPYAYPVYRIGYQEKLQVVKDYLAQWPTLHLVGRTGAFHYMNSDGVIEDVFRLVKELFPEESPEVKPLVSTTGRWL